MSWIPSYNMWGDCQQYTQGVKMCMDIILGLERLMMSGFILMMVLQGK